MTLLATLGKRWLVDVGFGDSFREPLLLEERAEQVDLERAYRIDPADDNRLIPMRQEKGGERAAQYRFSLEPHAFVDYAGMCHYHQTSPESHLTQWRVCLLATRDGWLQTEWQITREIWERHGGGPHHRILSSAGP